MAIVQRITGDVQVSGTMTAASYVGIGRSSITQEDLAEYPIPLADWRQWDALATLPPGPSNDDLGIVTGTFGTHYPYISAGDLKNAGATTRRIAAVLQLPPEYVAGQSIQVKFWAGMLTTVASVSATIDVEAYASAGTGVPTGSPTDLCQTAAQSINSTIHAAKTFEIDGSGLAPGDELIIRVSIAVNDSATVTAVDARFTQANLLLDIKS